MPESPHRPSLKSIYSQQQGVRAETARTSSRSVSERTRSTSLRFGPRKHPADLAAEDEGQYWAGRMHGGKAGDRRAGVVWHTQGSGKSFSMPSHIGLLMLMGIVTKNSILLVDSAITARRGGMAFEVGQ